MLLLLVLVVFHVHASRAHNFNDFWEEVNDEATWQAYASRWGCDAGGANAAVHEGCADAELAPNISQTKLRRLKYKADPLYSVQLLHAALRNKTLCLFGDVIFNK